MRIEIEKKRRVIFEDIDDSDDMKEIYYELLDEAKEKIKIISQEVKDYASIITESIKEKNIPEEINYRVKKLKIEFEKFIKK